MGNYIWVTERPLKSPPAREHRTPPNRHPHKYIRIRRWRGKQLLLQIQTRRPSICSAVPENPWTRLVVVTTKLCRIGRICGGNYAQDARSARY
jgi:hypothetical protein